MENKITVVGGGSWGTALAHFLGHRGIKVRLWVRESEIAEAITAKGENPVYMPGIKLSGNITAGTDLPEMVDGARLVLMVPPCQVWRGVLREMRPYLRDDAVLISASKGVEVEGLKRMEEVAATELAGMDVVYAALSGPSFAKEVIMGKPTAAVIACRDITWADRLRDWFSGEAFRFYSSRDVTGVELGGAVKNVIAIAAGLSDGLGFGLNAKAALITRGLVEITRLGLALGASASTFTGLSGVGDLILTATGDLSRNRQVGLRTAELGAKEALAGMTQVAEGRLRRQVAIPAPSPLPFKIKQLCGGRLFIGEVQNLNISLWPGGDFAAEVDYEIGSKYDCNSLVRRATIWVHNACLAIY